MQGAPEIVFTPGICEKTKDKDGERDGAYKGTITLRVPSYDEKMEFPELSEIIALAKGQEDSKEARKIQLSFVRQIVRDHLPKFFVKSSVVRVADNFAFDTLQKMQYEHDFSSVFIELATELSKPYHLGNGSTPTP